MIEDKDLDIMQILTKIHEVKMKAVEDYKEKLREKIGIQRPLSPTIKTDLLPYYQGVDDTYNAFLDMLEEKQP